MICLRMLRNLNLSLLKGEYYGNFPKIKQILFIKSVQKILLVETNG